MRIILIFLSNQVLDDRKAIDMLTFQRGIKLFAFFLYIACPLFDANLLFGEGSSYSFVDGHDREATISEQNLGDDIMTKRRTPKQGSKARQPFQPEQLEPRLLFTTTPLVSSLPIYQSNLQVHQTDYNSGGQNSTWDASLVKLIEESPAPPSLVPHNEIPLTNFGFLPLLQVSPITSTQTGQTLQLDAQVEVNNVSDLSLQWTQVSGPGSAVFDDAYSANSGVQFDQEGTYELLLEATNLGQTARASVFVTVTAANVVNIDQAWLDAQGDGPYYLDQEGTTYLLQTDVTTDGTAFAVIADDVTFDLNGHTVTYDNGEPVTVFNGSFESGTGTSATGWDFSGAANAERSAETFLSNQVYDGDYSLKFNPGFNGTQTIISTGTVTLEANTTYSLSAMMQHKGFAKDSGLSTFVKLVGQDVADEYEVFWGGKNNRGIQLRIKEFTTGEVGGTYKIVVGANNPEAIAGFTPYIDDINIQRNKVYGVAANVRSSRQDEYPDISRHGSGQNVTIRNGTITQGHGNGTNSVGVSHYSSDAEVANLTITVAGANSKVIEGTWSDQARIHDNILISNVQTIVSRDSFDGAVISKAGGQIYNNTIIGGPHVGIHTVGTENLIYGNQISIRSKYTNGFAIQAWNDHGSEIYDNTIETTTEDFGGRGIQINRQSYNDPANMTIVRNNNIKVREMPRNQEYAGVVLGGAYGIQLEGSRDVEIYGNTVEAIADAGDGYALRLSKLTQDEQGHNIYVHDNTFRGTRLNTDVNSASVKVHDLDNTHGVRIENNLLVSNHGWLGETRAIVDFEMVGNEFSVEGDGVGFIPVQATNYGNNEEKLDKRATKGLRFIDNQFTDVAAHDLFVSSPLGNWHSGWFDGTEPNSWIFHGFTTTLQVKDHGGTALPNASVTIVDKDGNQVFEGNSDANGQVATLLQEFRLQGDEKTEYGPYTVTIAHNGEQTQQQFSADRVQTIDVQLNVSAAAIPTESSQFFLGDGLQDNLSSINLTTTSRVESDGYQAQVVSVQSDDNAAGDPSATESNSDAIAEVFSLLGQEETGGASVGSDELITSSLEIASKLGFPHLDFNYFEV